MYRQHHSVAAGSGVDAERVRRFRAGLVYLVTLATLGPIGCSDRPIVEQATGADSEERAGGIQIGDVLRAMIVTRIARTPTELADRADLVVELLTGATCDAREADAWAVSALSDPGLMRSAKPFSCASEVEVWYQPRTDALSARDTSLRPGSVEKITAAVTAEGMNPALGVGKASARTTAKAFFDNQLLPSPVISGSWAPLEASRVVDRTSVQDAAWVREYQFLFRRTEVGIPFLDTYVHIGVHRSGALSQVVVSDVESQYSGRDSAAISEEDAKSRWLQGADAYAATYSSSVNAPKTQVGYNLDENADSAELFPVLFGELSTMSSSGSLSRTFFAQVRLTESHEFELLAPWDYVPQAAPRDDGKPCREGSECSSGHCYLFTGYYGLCGDCGTDEDCHDGCSPPNVLGAPGEGSRCGDAALGSGCETDAACTAPLICSSVASAAGGFDVRGCSGCADDNDCTSGDLCEPVFAASTGRASRQCVGVSSRADGEVCDRSSACVSGQCATLAFLDGSEVGVCGPCSSDTQCASGFYCSSPSLTLGVGLGPSQCLPN